MSNSPLVRLLVNPTKVAAVLLCATGASHGLEPTCGGGQGETGRPPGSCQEQAAAAGMSDSSARGATPASSSNTIAEIRTRCDGLPIESPNFAACLARLSCVEDGIAEGALVDCIGNRLDAKVREAQALLAQRRAEQARAEAELALMKGLYVHRVPLALDDPRRVFREGERWQIDALIKTRERYGANAAFTGPSFRVEYRSEIFTVRTRMLSATQSPAVCEIVAVTLESTNRTTPMK